MKINCSQLTTITAINATFRCPRSPVGSTLETTNIPINQSYKKKHVYISDLGRVALCLSP